MKKILLTIVAGMLMLSLPVIASATPGYDNYSGYCASVSFHGFQLYSTAKGATAGMKAFAQTYKATGTAKSGLKNAYGKFYTGTGNYFYAQVQQPTTFIYLNSSVRLII